MECKEGVEQNVPSDTNGFACGTWHFAILRINNIMTFIESLDFQFCFYPDFNSPNELKNLLQFSIVFDSQST